MDESQERIIGKRIDELEARANDGSLGKERTTVAYYRLMEAKYLYAMLMNIPGEKR